MEQMVAATVAIATMINGRAAQLENRGILEGLAKKAKIRGGVTQSEARSLMEWADEYGLSRSRGIERHLNRNFIRWHIRIGDVNKIKVTDVLEDVLGDFIPFP